MIWIAVHEDVLGSKLRGLRNKLNCSEIEALGVLVYVWLWARKNADNTGYITNANKSDISRVIALGSGPGISSDYATEALIELGWIDEKEDKLYIHDWEIWQSFSYEFFEKHKRDSERKKSERANKEQKPVKTKYAERVTMLSSERAKLVSEYGEEFTQKLIDELNNYKLANGKSYKDDYRAILNWVVDKCLKKYPKLVEKKEEASIDEAANPFADYL